MPQILPETSSTQKLVPPTSSEFENSMGDLNNGAVQEVRTSGQPIEQKFVKKKIDLCWSCVHVTDQSRKDKKKKAKHVSLPISVQVNVGESPPVSSVLQLPQNASMVSPMANRKPMPLPTRGYALNDADAQTDENKINIEPDAMKKRVKKTSLPTLLQEHQTLSEEFSIANRKPMPLPTREFAKLGVSNEYFRAVCEPLTSSKQQFISQTNENESKIELDAIGKNLDSGAIESNGLSGKEGILPSSKMTGTKKKASSTSGRSTSHTKNKDKFPQEVKNWTCNEVINQEHTVNKKPIANEPHHYEVVRCPQAQCELLRKLPKDIRRLIVHKKVPKCEVEDHSRLSLIITPSSSEDELFDEEQDEGNREASLDRSKAFCEVTSRPLPRPPNRMVTPEFLDKGGFFVVNVKNKVGT